MRLAALLRRLRAGYGSDGSVIVDGKVIDGSDGSDGRVIVEGRWNRPDVVGVVVGAEVVVVGDTVVVVTEGAPPWLPLNNATMPQMIRTIRIAKTMPNHTKGLRYQGVGGGPAGPP